MIGLLARAVLRERVEAPVPVPEGVAVRKGRWIPELGGRLSGMRGHAAAVTLGSTIVVHPEAELDARLLRHELAHVAQWERHPWTFPLRYAWEHVRRGYGGNRYELEARNAERREC